MSSKIDPAELRTANDLLKDFAVSPDITAEEVYQISWSRFNILEQSPLHEIFERSWFMKLFGRTVYTGLPLAFHRFIYDGLFTFAGKFRHKNDPHGGHIYYGHQHAQRRRPKFQGSPPEKIGSDIFDAAWFLKKDPKDPLYNAFRFYQKFVHVHPFYDANGRIGRLIATMYLADHNLVLSWSEFDSRKKFLKKLNRCHLKPDEENFGYLVDYLRPFILNMDDLES